MNHECTNGDSRFEERAAILTNASTCGRVWSIILAGGNGDRISDFIRSWKGRVVPKQYCAFTGKRSMLQHTLQRAEALSPRQRTLVLIAETHRREARAQLAERWSNGVIMQPANRDTLPGILLPLTHVYARDPNATVAIFPSDHFIYPEDSFRAGMLQAVQAVEALPNRLILVGAPAIGLELEYGWVCPGEQIWASGEHSVFSVQMFLEKPSCAQAAVAKARGGLWNTMIVVVKAHALWQLACSYFPEIMKLFGRLRAVIGTSREEETRRDIYEIMPARNFSSGLLTEATDQIAVMPMKDVLWCDWGRKERILEVLRHIGKQPNFPPALAIGEEQTGRDAEVLPWQRAQFPAVGAAANKK